MDDLNALERQIEGQLNGFVGPVLPVDDAAIFDGITAASRPRKWGFGMFSALKFIAAAVIVALFGGFLVAGVLTTPQRDEMVPAAVTESQSPTTAEELLSGMITEEVQPGVLRVVNDGVRDLVSVDAVDIVAGTDGSVRVFGSGRFFRLGDEEDVDASGAPPHDSVGAGPDGTVWLDGTHWGPEPWEGLAAFDGDEWTRYLPTGIPDDHRPWSMHVASDGSVWVLLAGRGVWVPSTALVARFDHGDWQIAEFVSGGLPELFGGDGDSIWAVTDRPRPSSRPEVYRFDGTGWQQQDTPDGFAGSWDLLVGPDDTLWTVLRQEHSGDEADDCDRCPSGVAHFDGTDWQEWQQDHFPKRGDESLLSALRPLAVAPDDSLWGEVLWGSSISPFSEEWTEPGCNGVARFDGTAPTRYLEGLCIGAIDVTPDSTVWLLAGSDDTTTDIYVIRPEAAALPAVTEPPPPTTTEALLSGMVTEEVEPGVFRVVNDGVRDISNPDEGFPGYMVNVTPDGSVWLSGEGGRQGMFRLGDEATFDDPTYIPPFKQVAPDGSLWAIAEGNSIRSFDGQAWTKRMDWSVEGVLPGALAIGPDGTVWVTASDRDERCLDSPTDCPFTVLMRLDEDGSLTTIDGWADVYAGAVANDELAVSPDRDVWLIGRDRRDTLEADVLLRFDGQEWHLVPGPDGFIDNNLGQSIAFGPDGTLWVHTRDPEGEDRPNGAGLARFADPGWTTFTEADGVQHWGGQGFIFTDLLHVAADGSLWMNGSDDTVGCGGVAHFDGTTWTSYLRGLCVHDLDISPDGGVWTRADRYSGMNPAEEVSTYVITPEAVADTE